MAGNVVEIDDNDFDKDVLKSDVPVLIDFWASWCGPCRAIAPLIEELAETYAGKIKFMKMNVDDNPITPGKYGIRAIPTLIFFKDGEVFEQKTGMIARPKLEETIDRLVSE